MRTFLIREVRQNEKAETFEVITKVRFASLAALIRYLEANNNTLWNGTATLEGEGKTKKIHTKKPSPPPLLLGEGSDI